MPIHETPKGRVFKKWILDLLQSHEMEQVLRDLSRIPPRKVVSPLISFFNHRDEAVKWSAVVAMGSVVARLADEDMEAARVVMRRLMWSLNDESGGIGWGCPEAMGEIMVRHEALAKEYIHVLVSYTWEQGNYLELPGLQRGLLWAIARLAKARADLVRRARPTLLPYLDSEDATVRGLAAWICGLLGIEEAGEGLNRLLDDDQTIQIFWGGSLKTFRVQDLAEKALDEITDSR